MVGGDGLRSAFEGDDAREPDAAPDFDGSFAGEGHARNVPRERDGTRPQVRPVWDALVLLEFLLVEKRVGGGGVCDVKSLSSGFDDGL